MTAGCGEVPVEQFTGQKVRDGRKSLRQFFVREIAAVLTDIVATPTMQALTIRLCATA